MLSLGCANKDFDGFFGPLCKFIEYCRIVALLPVIHYTQKNNCNSATILEYSMNLHKGPKNPSRSLFAQPIISTTYQKIGDLFCLVHISGLSHSVLYLLLLTLILLCHICIKYLRIFKDTCKQV